MSRVNKDEIVSSIQNAQSIGVLSFVGEVLRIHKEMGLPHTHDTEFMSKCRDSFKSRKKFLTEEEDGIRQQSNRRAIQEHAQADGQAPGLQGQRGSGRQALLGVFMDQGVEEGCEVHVTEPDAEG